MWADQSAWPAQPDNIKVTEIDSQSNKDKKKGSDDTGAITNTKTEKKTAKKEAAIPKNTEQTKTELDDLPLPPGISIEDSTPQITDKTTPDDKDTTTKTNNNSDIAKGFTEWVSNGIADGSLPINVQSALVHTIGDNKDLILVSPLIFRQYAKKYDLDYKQVQHAFQTLKLHTTTSDNKNVMKFETISLRKNKPPKTLNGILIESAEEKLGIRLPPGNIHIKMK